MIHTQSGFADLKSIIRSTSKEGHAPSIDGGCPTKEGHAPSIDGGCPSKYGHAPTIDGGCPTKDGHAPSILGERISKFRLPAHRLQINSFYLYRKPVQFFNRFIFKGFLETGASETQYLNK